MKPVFTWTAAGVREALGLGGVGAPEDQSLVFAGVSTDSRTLHAGDLFVALEGPSFDGHDFLAQAAQRGARGAVVRRIPAGRPPDLPLFPVPDTLAALGALAHYRRLRLPARVVAITGSSGKTTTKELLRAALGRALRVHATEANLNNQVGVPQTLLAAPEDADVVIVEIGTSGPGEIAPLRAVAHPDVAVIVTVSEAHVERLGDLEGVYREKLSLVQELPTGAAVVVGDDPSPLADRARALTPGHELRVTGLTDAADQPWRGRRLEADGEGRWRIALPSGTFQTPVPGAHGAQCALLALAVADLLGVPSELARAGLADTRLPGMRTELRRLPRGVLLVDCYNANPQSTVASLRWLAALPSRGPRMAVLGSMLELGALESSRHDAVLAEALALGLDVVLGVGRFSEAIRRREETPGSQPDGPRTGGRSETHGPQPAPVPGPDEPSPRLLAAADLDEALVQLLPLLEEGATVLLKGSRGARLEALLPVLEATLTRGGED